MSRVLTLLAQCPYCSGNLRKAPTRSHRCPKCKNTFHILQDVDGNTYAVTEDEISAPKPPDQQAEPFIPTTPPSVETLQPNTCPGCAIALNNEMLFCPRCGKEQARMEESLCSNCGFALMPGIPFCPHCGEDVPKAAPTCRDCGLPLNQEMVYCPRCGLRVSDSN